MPAFVEQVVRAHLTWGALRQDKLVRIAKKLKKNNVAVDVVAFGSEGKDANAEKLEAFREAVNSGDNSHLVTVPAGTVLSDMLFSSPIFQVARATAMILQAAQEGRLLVPLLVQGTCRKQQSFVRHRGVFLAALKPLSWCFVTSAPGSRICLSVSLLQFVGRALLQQCAAAEPQHAVAPGFPYEKFMPFV